MKTVMTKHPHVNVNPTLSEFMVDVEKRVTLFDVEIIPFAMPVRLNANVMRDLR